MRILTGDIGGTKTRIALLESSDGQLEILQENTYPSCDYDSLTSILSDFVRPLKSPPQAAGFAIAGPTDGRICQVTNLPWQIDADELEKLLSVPRVILLNDLEATAWGIDILGDDNLVSLQQGIAGASGNRTVIAAGTGLGQAGLFWDGECHTPFASEGGHCDFAPQSELEFELLKYLQKRHHHASWERVVSGPGLVDIYHFLCEYRDSPTPEPLSQEMVCRDPAAAIAKAADQNSDNICVETMQLFTHLYGAETGNQALKHMATGGVFIGGGIAPKILPWLQRPGFIDAFRSKGQMRELMEKMSVKVILNDRTALYGPAVRLLSELTPQS